MVGNMSVNIITGHDEYAPFVSDVSKPNRRFLTCNELCRTYCIHTNITEYYGIIISIKSKCPQEVNTRFRPPAGNIRLH